MMYFFLSPLLIIASIFLARFLLNKIAGLKIRYAELFAMFLGIYLVGYFIILFSGVLLGVTHTGGFLSYMAFYAFGALLYFLFTGIILYFFIRKKCEKPLKKAALVSLILNIINYAILVLGTFILSSI